jgi:hypothetical protein
MSFEPQRSSGDGRINPGSAPPCSFVTAAVYFAMVPSTQRNRELIADLATERPALRKTQVMGIRRAAVANQARLLGHEPDVVPITNPARLR